MNQKLKQAGLFAILAVFTISLTTSFVGDADASPLTRELSTKTKQSAQVTPEPVSLSLKQMELRDQTGDHEVKGKKDGFVPRADDYGLETFRAVYTIVNEGNGTVKNIEILVTSDTETVSGELQGNLDRKYSTITVMIKAVDPASINAEIVGFEI